MPASRGRSRYPWRVVAYLAIACGLWWVSSFPRTYDDDELPSKAPEQHTSELGVPYPVELDKLVVTIRTTATEAFAKLPTTLLLTDVIYHDGLNVVGDLHMDVGAFHVHDVLEGIDPNVLFSNPELERYGRQIRLVKASVDLSTVKERDAAKEKEVLANMDKYKCIRMLEKAWQLKPDRNWYVFVDADTYVLRTELMDWLGHFNPDEATFFGDPMDSEQPGAGSDVFVLSGRVMRMLFVERKNVAAQWDARIADFRTGFDVLSAFMRTELNIDCNRSWPGISAYNPYTAAYGPGVWCEQVRTLHEVSPKIASELWHLQRNRDDHGIHDPLTFADLYNIFVRPENLSVPREHWDNLSSGPDNARYNILFGNSAEKRETQDRDDQEGSELRASSWEACAESCNNLAYCAQFSYSSIPMPNHNENGKTKCHLSSNLRMGRHTEPTEVVVNGEKTKLEWRSGWRKDAFESWANQQRCKGQQN